MPSTNQFKFLNDLLSVLANDYRAEVGDELWTVKITFQMGSFNRAECGLTIDPSEDGDGKWTVNTLVTSGGSYDCPPDVDLVEVQPPTTWENACAALVRNIVAKLIEDAFCRENDKQFAQDLEDSEAWAAQGLDPDYIPF